MIIKINNETLGQTAEKVICDLMGLDNSLFVNRTNVFYEKKLNHTLKKAINELPLIIRHSGLESGIRGKLSKSPVDFYG